jgi:hypothetical protein
VIEQKTLGGLARALASTLSELGCSAGLRTEEKHLFSDSPNCCVGTL